MSLHPSRMMEAEQYDQLATGAWPSWNDDSFNQFEWNDNPNTFEDSCITADYVPLESLDVPEFLLTSNAQTDGSTFGSASKSEEIPQLLDPPWFQPTSMMNIISPVSSDDTTWTSPSLEFDFNSPVIETTWSQSGVSQLDKVAWAREDPSFNTANIATMDTVQQPPPQFAPETSLLDGAQQPLRSSAIGIELRTMEDRPPGFSSREWRMIVRPEKCPKCQKGHSHRSELKKHILVHHPELAAEYGIRTEPYACQWCKKQYTRPDRLTRHRTQKHGRQKNATRSRQGRTEGT